MAKHNQGRRNLILLLVVIFGLLLLISFTGEGREHLTPVEDALLAFFAPVQNLFSSAGQRIQSWLDAAVSFHELRAENDKLREEIAFVEGLLIQFQEMQKQNARYRQMLEFKESSEFDLLAAELIARDPSQWFGTITINRGYLDGVRKESPVITDRGLVGMVSNVSPNSSQVILITDPRLAVSAMVQRSREPGLVGIVEGYAQGPTYLRMTNLPPDVQVQPGDAVISSGLGGVFPKGLYIGTVKDLGEDHDGLVQSVTIEPRVNFNRLEEVFIVIGPRPEIPDGGSSGGDDQG